MSERLERVRAELWSAQRGTLTEQLQFSLGDGPCAARRFDQNVVTGGPTRCRLIIADTEGPTATASPATWSGSP